MPRGRKPQVRYWNSRGGYCCTISGTQHLLAAGADDAPTGPVYLAALTRFRELLELESVNHAGDRNSVAVLAEAYCRWVESHRKGRTLEVRKRCLTPFVAGFGARTVASLVRHEITVWLESMKVPRKHGRGGHTVRWGKGQLRIAMQSLNAMFNWGVKQELITRNPCKGLEVPAVGTRGKEAYLNPEQVKQVLGSCRRDFREFCVALRDSGARPGEIANARGSDYDPAIKSLVFPAEGRDDGWTHKTHRSGRDRVVYLSGDALAVIEARVKRFGKDYLFPARAGYAADKQSKTGKPRSQQAVSRRFMEMRARTGIKGLTSYSFRHTFATNWLMKGGDIETLAEVMGTSADKIRKHYKHLDANRPALHARVAAFNSSLAQTPESGGNPR